jgi:hypothetical protein
MGRPKPDVPDNVRRSHCPYKHVDPEVMTRAGDKASKGGHMYRSDRSTGSGGIALPGRFRRSKQGRRGGTCRTIRAVARLVRSRRALAHVPTAMQVRAMAHFEGREPCSYLLDPAVNYVPELPLGGEDPLGRHALCSPAVTPTAGGGSSS